MKEFDPSDLSLVLERFRSAFVPLVDALVKAWSSVSKVFADGLESLPADVREDLFRISEKEQRKARHRKRYLRMMERRKR